jgi:D-alanine-D-alanine ligase
MKIYKQNILVFYGGRSCEHDISVITAVQVMGNMDLDKYNIFPVYIDKRGVPRTTKNFLDVGVYKSAKFDKKEWKRVALLPHSRSLYELKGQKRLSKLCDADAALICNHGMNGEDGTLQGLLELCNIPYGGSGVAGSAIGMDKIIMKRFFNSLGLKVLPFTYTDRLSYQKNKEAELCKIEQNLAFPMIVKPSNLGSSIGINKCANRRELSEALEVALKFDSRAVIEHAVKNIKEVNCSAIRDDGKILLSECEEPVVWRDFLSFDDKYLQSDKGGMSGLKRKMPAEITLEQKADIENTTETVYRELLCNGVIRVDYIIDGDDQSVYINEINTIPGSFAFYLWQKTFSFSRLIDVVLNGAIAAHAQKNLNSFAFDSAVLSNFGTGDKGGAAKAPAVAITAPYGRNDGDLKSQ